MGNWTRRKVLEFAAGSTALSLLGCKKKRDPLGSSPSPTKAPVPALRPRYIVQVVMGGGIDPILTTDPRTKAEVADGIEVPYGPEEIIEHGNARLGPEFRLLKKLSVPLAIVNGVALRTANHHTGFEQLTRLRTRVDQRLPSLGDIVGAHRPDIPVGSVSLGLLQRHDYSPGWLNGNDLFDQVEKFDAKDIAMLGEVLEGHAKELSGEARLSARATAENVDRVGRLLKRLPGTTAPRFGSLPGSPHVARLLERTLWALENDVAASLYVKVAKFEWDTHDTNFPRQREMMRSFLPPFLSFLDMLAQIENDRGRLIDQTLVIAASEIGRFPRLNARQGKDHFPEAPFIFAGAGISTTTGCEVFGATGRETEAFPVDLKTGKRAEGGHVLTLDDIGTTVLTMAGISPEPYGYRGRALPFLMRDVA